MICGAHTRFNLRTEHVFLRSRGHRKLLQCADGADGAGGAGGGSASGCQPGREGRRRQGMIEICHLERWEVWWVDPESFCGSEPGSSGSDTGTAGQRA